MEAPNAPEPRGSFGVCKELEILREPVLLGVFNLGAACKVAAIKDK